MVAGLSELRARALKDKTPFPYDVEVPGLRVLDLTRILAGPVGTGLPSRLQSGLLRRLWRCSFACEDRARTSVSALLVG